MAAVHLPPPLLCSLLCRRRRALLHCAPSSPLPPLLPRRSATKRRHRPTPMSQTVLLPCFPLLPPLRISDLLSLSPPALPYPLLPCCCAWTIGKDGRCRPPRLALLRRAVASTAAAPALFSSSALALSHAKRRHEEREGMTGGPNLAVRGKGLTGGVMAGLLCGNHGRIGERANFKRF